MDAEFYWLEYENMLNMPQIIYAEEL